MHPVRHVYGKDAVCLQYWWPNDTRPGFAFKVVPRKCWVDAEGSVYCQVHYQATDGSSYEGAGLLRVDKQGTVHEVDWIVGAPAEGKTADWAYKQLERIDPDIRKKLGDISVYWVYYRR